MLQNNLVEDLFVPDTAGTLISRINRLTPHSQPLWGKMTVGQMLAHCEVPMEIALNDRKAKIGLMGMIFGKMVRKKLADGKPLAKNLPTVKSFRVTSQQNFEEEKNKLISLLERFQKAGPAGIGKQPHPFFGWMTPEEWSISSWKHLDHHLRQFNV